MVRAANRWCPLGGGLGSDASAAKGCGLAARQRLAGVRELTSMRSGGLQLRNSAADLQKQLRERAGLLEPREPIRGDGGHVSDLRPLRRASELFVMRKPINELVTANMQLRKAFVSSLRSGMNPDGLLEQPPGLVDVAVAMPERVGLHDERLAMIPLEPPAAFRSIRAFPLFLLGFLSPLPFHDRRLASQTAYARYRCRNQAIAKVHCLRSII